jgi:predicted RNase H-like nuclease (RuvC/YqgF family)
VDIAAIIPTLLSAGTAAILTAWYMGRNSAKKTDIDALCQTVNMLQDENKRQADRITALEAAKDLLRTQLAEWQMRYARLDVEWQGKYAALQRQFDDMCQKYADLEKDAQELGDMYRSAAKVSG